MVNLFLDPFIFACPQSEQGSEELERYIESILLWKELKETTWATIYVSAQTFDVLEETKSYPMWDFVNRFGKQSIQRRDVLNTVNGLLNKLPNIEDRLSIREILWDDMQCAPIYYLHERHSLFIEQCQRLMAFMALFCIIESLKEDDQILITRNLLTSWERAKV
jgi:hypothetical protein